MGESQALTWNRVRLKPQRSEKDPAKNPGQGSSALQFKVYIMRNVKSPELGNASLLSSLKRLCKELLSQ